MASVELSNFVEGANHLLDAHGTLSATLSVRPPFTEVGEGLIDAVLGLRRSEVYLGYIASDNEESVFLAEASRCGEHHTELVLQRIGARLGQLRDNMSDAAEMALESPFKDEYEVPEELRF